MSDVIKCSIDFEPDITSMDMVCSTPWLNICKITLSSLGDLKATTNTTTPITPDQKQN